MSGTIKMQLVITNQEVTSDYVFETLFKISSKSKNLKHAEIAKQIIIMAARRGESGLFDKDWKSVISELQEKYDIKAHVYFSIIKKLRDSGMLRKSVGKFYVTKDFAEHMTKMVSAINAFYMDLGVLEIAPGIKKKRATE